MVSRSIIPLMSIIRDKLGLIAIGVFYILALFNPIFKKYDYGAGFPLVILMAGLALLLVILYFREKRERPIFEIAMLGVFVLSMGASFIFSHVQNLGFSEVLAFASAGTVFWIVAYRKNPWIDKFLNLVAISAVLASLVGFFNYFTQGEVRLAGMFFNLLYHAHIWPNAFALFLLLSWPSFLRNWNWLRAVGLGIVISALLLTFSRGALIAFAGQLVLVAIYFARRIEKKAVLAVGLSILVAAVGYFGANYVRSMTHEVIDVGERVTFGNEESLTSKQERIDFWEGAVDLADDYPLFGYGPFSFRYAYNPIQETFLGNADHPHNVFLKIAVENGLVAAGSFVLFLLAMIVTVARRFKDLKKDDRDKLAVLFVACAGAFAHNLIDYNLNFAVNLFVLFVFLSLGRSIVAKVGKASNKSMAIGPLLLGLIVTAFAFYEGAILVLSETKDDSYLEHSLFPRAYYLNEADEALNNGDYDLANEFLDEQLELNKLDAQAYYLKGVVCEKTGGECLEYFETALELNPMNDFNYYAEYLTQLDSSDVQAAQEFANEANELLELYFGYVDNNVHFTAYTPNVEAAARLAELLIPYSEDPEALVSKTDKMLERAEELRMEKTY